MVETKPFLNVALDCDLAAPYRNTIAIIGNLDGVHLGHQALIEAAKKLAGDTPLSAVVFAPHPRQVFKPDTPPFLLTDLPTKADLLRRYGIANTFALPFTAGLYTQSPETFVQVTLRQRLGLKGIVTGSDFQFGAGRTGDAAALKDLAQGAGMSAHSISPVPDADGTKYSSSTVRQALRDGDPATAALHLGRQWQIRGTVIEGRKLARTLNFPTANLLLGDYVRPKYGVYVVNAHTPHGQFGGVANIGIRPTVDGAEERLEAHLFNFDDDLYGSPLAVDLLHFLRPEQKFDSIDSLKAQIATDSDTAQAWLARN
ncbi:MAG: riboflavin biosynthesis protein RibF [Pseudomonadota bacterium]